MHTLMQAHLLSLLALVRPVNFHYLWCVEGCLEPSHRQVSQRRKEEDTEEIHAEGQNKNKRDRRAVPVGKGPKGLVAVHI